MDYSHTTAKASTRDNQAHIFTLSPAILLCLSLYRALFRHPAAAVNLPCRIALFCHSFGVLIFPVPKPHRPARRHRISPRAPPAREFVRLSVHYSCYRGFRSARRRHSPKSITFARPFVLIYALRRLRPAAALDRRQKSFFHSVQPAWLTQPAAVIRSIIRACDIAALRAPVKLRR